ncbi:hypothetical protein [Corynebacterium sphenisci]|uniref:hypothetical protein n=1 Tax=Corynebacterium sphenisci TaxID=191493 RepID=UPI0026DFD3CA|nr:hypothetical protein [Corynebacterium sphenisci]MDO5732001.1 hypothetical protein [Corynebacterium sphenisci]
MDGDETYRAAVDWLAGADVADPAAVAVAGLLEELARPRVAVRGDAPRAVAALAADLADPGYAAVADPGPVGRVAADAVVRLSPDPAARDRGRELIARPPGADAAALRARLAELLADPGARLGRLRRGLAGIAAAHPAARTGLEELLWPCG